MDWRDKYRVEPGVKLRLADYDPSATGKHKSHEEALPKIKEHVERMAKLQYLLYADGSQALLIVLQGLDAGGKDGTIRHLFSGMNPQGVSVACFKQPTPIEHDHDFLWRIHAHAPAKGQVVIFNRSHYEDVLVVRVHKLVPRDIWSKRYDEINDFESLLTRDGNVRILKFYLHISPEEQLARFEQRLDDPARNWKISESDYTEREHWPQYVEAYEEALARTSTKQAPWFVVPSNHKWFRDLVISRIVVDTLDEMGLKLPPTRVDLAQIAKKYHAAVAEAKNGGPGCRG
ncbi:polyphosphate kinase 2 family protein [Methylosinus sporium]|uniref:Polyphosphate kinase 2 family protein n=1 Tax=Methylosinus sporium TaxID=428 RepID=A0A549SMN6_METSR|nr:MULTISPECIES: polyphosphate kinase 2 family protein [Methylosinus]MBU3887783.1 polyphosphate kinase 2 family protein [Methylosinus sp. KRF6]TRL30885.1 polyphosphate kinase 2 family protein [Methylosinus sporium]